MALLVRGFVLPALVARVLDAADEHEDDDDHCDGDDHEPHDEHDVPRRAVEKVVGVVAGNGAHPGAVDPVAACEPGRAGWAARTLGAGRSTGRSRQAGRPLHTGQAGWTLCRWKIDDWMNVVSAPTPLWPCSVTMN